MYRSSTLPPIPDPYAPSQGASGMPTMRHYPGIGLPSMQHPTAHERPYHNMPPISSTYGNPEVGRGYPGMPPTMGMSAAQYHPYLEGQGRPYPGMPIAEPMQRPYQSFPGGERSFSGMPPNVAERHLPPGYGSSNSWYGINGAHDAPIPPRHGQFGPGPMPSGPPTSSIGPSFSSAQKIDPFNVQVSQKPHDTFNMNLFNSTAAQQSDMTVLDKMISLPTSSSMDSLVVTSTRQPHLLQAPQPPQMQTQQPHQQQPHSQTDQWPIVNTSDIFSGGTVTAPIPGGELTANSQLPDKGLPSSQFDQANLAMTPSNTSISHDDPALLSIPSDTLKQQHSPFNITHTPEPSKPEISDFNDALNKQELVHNDNNHVKQSETDKYLNPLEQMSSMDPGKGFQDFLPSNNSSSNPDLMRTLSSASDHQKPSLGHSVDSPHLHTTMHASNTSLHTAHLEPSAHMQDVTVTRGVAVVGQVDSSRMVDTSQIDSTHMAHTPSSIHDLPADATHILGRSGAPGGNSGGAVSSGLTASGNERSSSLLDDNSLHITSSSTGTSALLAPTTPVSITTSSIGSPHLSLTGGAPNQSMPSPHMPLSGTAAGQVNQSMPSPHMSLSGTPGAQVTPQSLSSPHLQQSLSSPHIQQQNSLQQQHSLSEASLLSSPHIMASPHANSLLSPLGAGQSGGGDQLSSTVKNTPDSTRNLSSDSLPPDITASLFTSTDPGSEKGLDASSPPYLTKHDSGAPPSLDQMFGSPDATSGADDFSNIFNDAFGHLTGGSKADVESKTDQSETYIDAMGMQRKKRGPRPRVKDPSAMADASATTELDDRKMNRGRPKRKEKDMYSPKIKKPRGRPPKDPQKMALYLAAKAGLDEPNAEVIQAAVIACEQAEKKAQDPNTPKRKRKMKPKMMDDELAHLTWDYKDAMNMGMTPPKHQRSMSDHGSTEYLNYIPNTAANAAAQQQHSGDLFEPEKAPASSTTELIQEYNNSDVESCMSISDMDTDAEQTEITVLGEDAKDFSDSLVRHSKLSDAVSRASRIHQILNTDDQLDESSSVAQLLRAVGLAGVFRKCQAQFLRKMGLLDTRSSNSGDASMNNDAASMDQHDTSSTSGANTASTNNPIHHIRQLAISACEPSNVDTLSRQLDRMLASSELASVHNNTVSSTQRPDAMLVLLLLEQTTAMLACHVYTNIRNQGDTYNAEDGEDFNGGGHGGVSRGDRENCGAAECFMCHICVQAFKNMNSYKSHLLKHFGLMHAVTLVNPAADQNTPHTAHSPHEASLVSGSVSSGSSSSVGGGGNNSSSGGAEVSGSYSCDLCAMAFPNRIELAKHAANHMDSCFTCTLCAQVYDSRISYMSHIACHEAGSNNHSSGLGAANSSGGLRGDDTASSCNARLMYECPVCHKRCHAEDTLTGHMQASHLSAEDVVPNTDCEICGKSLPDRAMLRQHYIKHTGYKPYSCTECGKTYRSAKQLRIHYVVHSNQRRHRCHVCTRTFYYQWHLAEHMNVHTTTEKQFRCDSCDKAFHTQLRLVKHQKNQHHRSNYYTYNNKPQQQLQPTYPPLQYHHSTSASTHHTHKQQASGAAGSNNGGLLPPYKCPACEQHFGTLRALDHHNLHEHGITPSSDALNRHQISCPACSKLFLDRSLMEAHYRYTHLNSSPRSHPQTQHPQLAPTATPTQRRHTHSGTMPHADGGRGGARTGGRSNSSGIPHSADAYHCSMCPKSFTHEAQLMAHKDQHHNTSMSGGSLHHLSPGGIPPPPAGGKPTATPPHHHASPPQQQHSNTPTSHQQLSPATAMHHITTAAGATGAGSASALSCDICGHQCKTDSDLQRHLTIHRRINANAQPHECQICFSVFTSNLELLQHQITVHGMDKSAIAMSTASSSAATIAYAASSNNSSPRAMVSHISSQGDPSTHHDPFMPRRSASSSCGLELETYMKSKSSTKSEQGSGVGFDSQSYGSCSDDDTDAYEDQRFEHESAASLEGVPPHPPLQQHQAPPSSQPHKWNTMVDGKDVTRTHYSTIPGNFNEEGQHRFEATQNDDGSEGGAPGARSRSRSSTCTNPTDMGMKSLSQLLETDGKTSIPAHKTSQFPGRSAMPKLEAFLSAPNNVDFQDIHDRPGGMKRDYPVPNRSPLLPKTPGAAMSSLDAMIGGGDRHHVGARGPTVQHMAETVGMGMGDVIVKPGDPSRSTMLGSGFKDPFSDHYSKHDLHDHLKKEASPTSPNVDHLLNFEKSSNTRPDGGTSSSRNKNSELIKLLESDSEECKPKRSDVEGINDLEKMSTNNEVLDVIAKDVLGRLSPILAEEGELTNDAALMTEKLMNEPALLDPTDAEDHLGVNASRDLNASLMGSKDKNVDSSNSAAKDDNDEEKIKLSHSIDDVEDLDELKKHNAIDFSSEVLSDISMPSLEMPAKDPAIIETIRAGGRMFSALSANLVPAMPGAADIGESSKITADAIDDSALRDGSKHHLAHQEQSHSNGSKRSGGGDPILPAATDPLTPSQSPSSSAPPSPLPVALPAPLPMTDTHTPLSPPMLSHTSPPTLAQQALPLHIPSGDDPTCDETIAQHSYCKPPVNDIDIRSNENNGNSIESQSSSVAGVVEGGLNIAEQQKQMNSANDNANGKRNSLDDLSRLYDSITSPVSSYDEMEATERITEDELMQEDKASGKHGTQEESKTKVMSDVCDSRNFSDSKLDCQNKKVICNSDNKSDGQDTYDNCDANVQRDSAGMNDSKIGEGGDKTVDRQNDCIERDSVVVSKADDRDSRCEDPTSDSAVEKS